MSTESTILVKKADGSSVRMTLADFKLYKTGGVVSEKGKKKEELPVKIENILPAVLTPVSKIFVDEAMAKKKTIVWKSEDHESLLANDDENDLKPSEVALTKLPVRRNDLLSKVLKNLKFSLKENLLARVDSLVISKLKDIRSDEQILDYAVRAENVGGLGLDKKKAEELLLAIKSSLTPVSKMVNVDRSQKNDEQILQQNVFSDRQKNVIKDFGNKPILHDVSPAQRVVEEVKKVVGPVDEIRGFTLVDFRRLGTSPKECVKILKEKLEVLKSDSIVIFLEAVLAWRESPLFRQYEENLSKAILSGKKIKEEIDANRGLSWEEFLELANFNAELSF
jgi:hypothetical protein